VPGFAKVAAISISEDSAHSDSDVAMNEYALSQLRKLSVPTIGFGPYWVAGCSPWLLLAVALRTLAFDRSSVLLFISVQFLLFLAFVIASQRMIELNGGSTALGKLSLSNQLRLAWSIIWRTFAVGLVAYYALVGAGMTKFMAAGFLYGFDGIVFNRYLDPVILWTPAIAILSFLMVVNRGAGRSVGLISAVRETARRWKYLVPSAAAIALAVTVINLCQAAVGSVLVEPLIDVLPKRTHFMLIVGFFFVFAYLRLWLTVAVLTLALRRSFRVSSF